MRTLTVSRRGRRRLVALFAGFLLLVAATSAEAAQRRDSPTAPTAALPSAAGTVDAIEKASYEGGSTGQGPADDAECESYANRINVLIDQLPLYYEPGGPNNTYQNFRDGISQLKAKAADRGCFLMH
jgi:hypothetical protein